MKKQKAKAAANVNDAQCQKANALEQSDAHPLPRTEVHLLRFIKMPKICGRCRSETNPLHEEVINCIFILEKMSLKSRHTNILRNEMKQV